MTAGHFCRFCINLLLCHSSFGLDDDENILMIGVITRPSFPTNRCPFWTTLDRRKNLFSSSSKFSTKSVKYFSSELKQEKQNRAHRCNLITRCFDAKLVFFRCSCFAAHCFPGALVWLSLFWASQKVCPDTGQSMAAPWHVQPAPIYSQPLIVH